MYCHISRAMRRSLIKRNQIYLHQPVKAFISTRILTRDNPVDQSCQRTDSELWSNLVKTVDRGGTNAEVALCEVSQMLNNGCRPNGYALVHLVRASSDLGYDSYCQQLHSYILKAGFVSNAFVSNALIGFYRRIDSLRDAHKLFVEIPQPIVISWNSLISGYVQSGRFGEALCLFLELERSDICLDAFSFTAALAACAQLSLLQLGRSVHSKIVKYGLECGTVVANCLVDMYGKCGFVQEAIQVFEDMIEKDIISWNSAIDACARNAELDLAFGFFHQMPNPDIISCNQLISGVALFGNIDDATQLLLSMPRSNSSSWNSILTGYVNRSQAQEALDFFSTMHRMDIEMDEFTMSIILSGVADLAALTWGTLIHCCAIKSGLETYIVVGSALIDMYSKCGQVKTAESVFQTLHTKNLVTWNAMISGYAHNGDSAKVIKLFERLKKVSDLKPDWVTFLNVLAACSHCEMQSENAIQFFESMINEYKIEPTVEHCCSMIRVMGLRGELWRVQRLIYELGFESYGLVWKALLGACGTSRDLKVANIAAAKVIELEGDDDYVYVMMSNIYASYGKWREVSMIRKLMRDQGVRKEVGCSWIEVENITSHSSIGR